MATITVNLTTEDVHRIVGMLAAGVDPMTDPDPEKVKDYDALGSALVQAVALRVRGPQVKDELTKALAAVKAPPPPTGDADEAPDR